MSSKGAYTRPSPYPLPNSSCLVIRSFLRSHRILLNSSLTFTSNPFATSTFEGSLRFYKSSLSFVWPTRAELVHSPYSQMVYNGSP